MLLPWQLGKFHGRVLHPLEWQLASLPHATTPYLSAVILAILGEAACGRVEVAAIERLIELFGDAPIGLGNVQGSPPVAAWDSADLPCIPVGVQ
jgi:hypothetical protein